MSTPPDRATTARAEILRRVEAARPQTAPPVTRDYDGADGPAGSDLIDLLVDRLEDYRATVRRCTAADLPAALASFLAGAPTVVIPPGVPASWLSPHGDNAAHEGGSSDDGGAVRGPVAVRDGDPVLLTVTELDAPGVAVVTGCAVAVAETGTLILDAGPDQGRRLLTLVPDHHICVVRADQIVARLPAALRRLEDPTRPLTMISGPSATSDIELNRVEGVHGPRRLNVVIVD
ncbi:MAG TPA: LUD domain-containing protein [Asanoa sp.]|nr:LUD domain-containing protein [Asanoa sp.]